MQEEDNDKNWWVILAVAAVIVVVFVYAIQRANAALLSNPADRIPDATAGSADWIAWHKAMLKAGYPKAEANRLFVEAVRTQASYEAKNYDLREYARTQGINLDTGVVSAVYDEGVRTYNAFNVGSANIGNAAMFGVLIVIALFAFVGYQMFKPQAE